MKVALLKRDDDKETQKLQYDSQKMYNYDTTLKIG